MSDPPHPPDRDQVTRALDAADAALRARQLAAQHGYESAAERAWDGLLTLLAAAWEHQPGDADEPTCPIPVEVALTRLNGTARTSIERTVIAVVDGPRREYRVTGVERVRIVEEARIGHDDDRVRDCVRVNPTRFLVARRLLSQTVQRLTVAAAVRDQALTEARQEHTDTTGPLLVALARQELHHA
jgi:hypothetical protein